MYLTNAINVSPVIYWSAIETNESLMEGKKLLDSAKHLAVYENRKLHRKIMSNVMRISHRCLKMQKKTFLFSRAREMIWATVWATLDQANKLHCITLNIKNNLQPRCVLPKFTYAKPSYWNSTTLKMERKNKHIEKQMGLRMRKGDNVAKIYWKWHLFWQ